MAGWSLPSGGAPPDWKAMAELLRLRGYDVEPGWEGFDFDGDSDDPALLRVVLSTLAAAEKDAPSRPLPPVVDGRSVDLYRMYKAVRGSGGFKAVSEGCRWGKVAADLGFGRVAGPALKLVYAKHLCVFEAWVGKKGRPEKVKGGKGSSPSPVKRKREEDAVAEVNVGRESLREMLKWMYGAARDPLAAAVRDGIPQGVEGPVPFAVCVWQVSRARNALVSGFPPYMRFQRQIKAHPGMYGGFPVDVQEGARVSSRVSLQNKISVLANLSDTTLSLENELSPYSIQRKFQRHDAVGVCQALPDRRVPLGRDFQAVVKEWEGPVTEARSVVSRWLGEEHWPSKDNHDDVDSEIIGKGRTVSCTCKPKVSVECVRLHVAESRLLLKCELGQAFYDWKFDKMGEEISLSWTEDEENRFKDLIHDNPSTGENSWKKICNGFSYRRRQDLVKYFFNVFLQHRRRYQNRMTPDNINSDDESDFVFLGGKFGHEKLCRSEAKKCVRNQQCDPD